LPEARRPASLKQQILASSSVYDDEDGFGTAK
jgi:hypothetical protein